MRIHDDTGCGKGELLVSVLYGEATTSERAELEAHMRGCMACRDELAAFRRVRGELQGWAAGPVPPVRVEIRPSLADRLRAAFAITPAWARLAAAGAFALVLASAVNLEVSVGGGGLRVSAGLLPRPHVTQTAAGEAPALPAQTVQVSDEELARRVDARVNEALRARLDTQKAELSAELDKVQRQLAASQSNELRQMAARLQAQRRKIETLERDLDRQAGYGASDLLFSSVGADAAPGS